MSVFYERLLLCRKKTSFTQEQMAKELGIVFRSYRRYESGESEPTVSTAAKIAEYFGVSLDYLAGLKDEE